MPGTRNSHDSNDIVSGDIDNFGAVPYNELIGSIDILNALDGSAVNHAVRQIIEQG
jgi:hypothetical protein